jgi:peptidoglycan/xylan/chitin deacetylase (PgdA/CDA1 family)
MRRQDLSVLILYYLGCPGIRNLLVRLQGQSLTRFVTFHDIPNQAVDNFRAILRFLKHKTKVVSLDDYFVGKVSNDKINVVITFDDGYGSWITNVVPALQELQMPATFFISSGFLGLAKKDADAFIRDRLKADSKALVGLTKENVRQLADAGFTIGGHTCNHVNLGQMEDVTNLTREVVVDKQKLESIIGREIHYFAYPFGACRNPKIDLIGVLKGAGYKGAVTTAVGFNTAQTNCHLLCRELTGAPISLPVFKARVFGTYDAIRFLKSQANKLFSPSDGNHLKVEQENASSV